MVVEENCRAGLGEIPSGGGFAGYRANKYPQVENSPPFRRQLSLIMNQASNARQLCAPAIVNSYVITCEHALSGHGSFSRYHAASYP